MKNHRWLRLLAVVSALAIALAACGGDDDDDDAASGTDETTTTEGGGEDRGNVDGTLVLGALLPQSGDLAVIYDALRVPVQIAVDEINAAGGVNGRPVRGQGRRRRHRRRTSPRPRSTPCSVPTTSTRSSVRRRRPRREGIIDKVVSNNAAAVLGFEHVVGVDRRRGRRLLLPYCAARQVPGSGTRAAVGERQPVEARDPRPQRLLRQRLRRLAGRRP